MAFNLRNRSFVKELDFTTEELKFLLKLSAELKAAKYGGYERQRLKGKNIALIFEKTSTRTRCAFEVAAYDQGAHVTYLGPDSSQIGHKESMKDTARVLGRMYDGIEYRGFAQATVETLAQYAGVPVWNGLPAGQVYALPAGLPQPRDLGGRRYLSEDWIGRLGSHRGGV
jgi:ornithine carbamoyltransferase